uniref:Uncharacterized protein n=1 Tax=Romanomermis culicivorax TaxID=13658 RepID=A0A915JPG8_ROMCU
MKTVVEAVTETTITVAGNKIFCSCSEFLALSKISLPNSLTQAIYSKGIGTKDSNSGKRLAYLSLTNLWTTFNSLSISTVKLLASTISEYFNFATSLIRSYKDRFSAFFDSTSSSVTSSIVLAAASKAAPKSPRAPAALFIKFSNSSS